MSATSRIFVAAPLDETSRAALERLDRWLDHLPTHRSVPSAQRHLTVAFLGEISAEEEAAVAEAVGRASRRHAPLEARLTGLMALPSLRRPRVLAAGVEGGAELIELMEDAARAAAEAAPTEAIIRALDRPTLPHITVGRSRGSRPPRPIDLSEAPVPNCPFQLTCLDVIRSTLTPRGPAYDVIVRYSLERNVPD